MSKNLAVLEPKPGAASFISRLIRQAATFIAGTAAAYDEEPWFNNQDMQLLAAGVQGASLIGPDITNHGSIGAVFTFDITAVPTIQTVQLIIEGKDPASGKYYTILAGAAEVAVATRQYKIYPGLVAAANAVANDVIPKVWRWRVVHSGAGNFTYSVGGTLLN